MQSCMQEEEEAATLAPAQRQDLEGQEGEGREAPARPPGPAPFRRRLLEVPRLDMVPVEEEAEEAATALPRSEALAARGQAE